MNVLALSAILALFAIESCSASAPVIPRQATIAVYVLSGESTTGTPYPNYTVSVPETGVTIPISRFLSLLLKLTMSVKPRRSIDMTDIA